MTNKEIEHQLAELNRKIDAVNAKLLDILKAIAHLEGALFYARPRPGLERTR